MLARLYLSKGEKAKADLHLELAGQRAGQQFEGVLETDV